MAKQPKLNPATKIRLYLRERYMSAQERMRDDADWKDGMNAFRLSIMTELIEINIKIDKLTKVLDETTKKSTNR